MMKRAVLTLLLVVGCKAPEIALAEPEPLDDGSVDDTGLSVDTTVDSGRDADAETHTDTDATISEPTCPRSLSTFTCPTPEARPAPSTTCSAEDITDILTACFDGKVDSATCKKYLDTKGDCGACVGRFTRFLSPGAAKIDYERCGEIKYRADCVCYQACLDYRCGSCFGDKQPMCWSESLSLCRTTASVLPDGCSGTLPCDGNTVQEFLRGACMRGGVWSPTVVDSGAPEAPADTSTDTGVSDTRLDAAGPLVKVTGTIEDLSGVVHGIGTVGPREDPTYYYKPGTSGQFVLMLASEVPWTLQTMPDSVMASSVLPPIVFHADSAITIRVMTRFMLSATIGSIPSGSGTMLFDVVARDGCSPLGGTIDTTPSGGKIIYTDALFAPAPTRTSLASTRAFVTALSGTRTPVITPTSPCIEDPFPVKVGSYTIVGPLEIVPGALHDTTLFIRK